MVRIGFDDDINENEELDNHQDTEEVYKKLNEKNFNVYIPERRIEQFKAEYDCVVVNDFGDEYHLSEEERAAKNKFYQAFKRFSKCKHKYRKIDEYVVAMREALKCLDFVAENNGVHTPEEFKKLFFRDKIYISGLFFPEFKGRERKQISWEYLTEFILSDEDPKKILPRNTEEEILTKEDYENLEDELFDKGELDKILAPETDKELHRKELFFDVEEDEPNGDTAIFLSNKQSKKLIKGQPEFLLQIKEMKRKKRSVDNLSRFIYDLTYDDIEAISSYDQRHNYQSSSDIPEFKGDLTKDSDYHKYLLQLEEFENTQIKDNYHGKLKTIEEIREIELKQLLENHNWNIRNLYENKDKERRLRKIQEKEKRKEKELRKKLIAVQSRRKRRMGEDVDDEKVKKKKKKGKKEKPKKDKEKNQYKKDTKENIDEFLLDSANRMDNFKEYEEESLDWSWDSIMNGRKNNGKNKN